MPFNLAPMGHPLYIRVQEKPLSDSLGLYSVATALRSLEIKQAKAAAQNTGPSLLPARMSSLPLGPHLLPVSCPSPIGVSTLAWWQEKPVPPQGWRQLGLLSWLAPWSQLRGREPTSPGHW